MLVIANSRKEIDVNTFIQKTHVKIHPVEIKYNVKKDTLEDASMDKNVI